MNEQEYKAINQLEDALCKCAHLKISFYGINEYLFYITDKAKKEAIKTMDNTCTPHIDYIKNEGTGTGQVATSGSYKDE